MNHRLELLFLVGLLSQMIIYEGVKCLMEYFWWDRNWPGHKWRFIRPEIPHRVSFRYFDRQTIKEMKNKLRNTIGRTWIIQLVKDKKTVYERKKKITAVWLTDNMERNKIALTTYISNNAGIYQFKCQREDDYRRRTTKIPVILIAQHQCAFWKIDLKIFIYVPLYSGLQSRNISLKLSNIYFTSVSIQGLITNVSEMVL